MTPPDRASWLPAALLLLWVPGCLSLSGPRQVTGTVRRTLSVQCRYEEEFTDNKKYWCRSPCLSLMENIVETTETEREVRSRRVSIRDHPENLTFTVTLENLRQGDEGIYGCGIDISWKEGLLDKIFWVEVSVSPAPISVSPTKSATAKTPTTTAKIPTVSTAPARVNVTHSANSQDNPHGLHTLLVLLALLLLLLVGTSLLAWRMVRRRTKAGGNPEPLQNPSQAAQQSEPCYANVQLQTWSLRGETVQPRQAEVEYSTVGPREDLHYTTVVFKVQNQDSQDKSGPQRRPQLEPEYSVIKRT